MPALPPTAGVGTQAAMKDPKILEPLADLVRPRYRSPEQRFFDSVTAVLTRAVTSVGTLRDYRVHLANRRELLQWIEEVLRISLPAKRCCRDHSTPMDAVADAYFAEHAVVVWLGSRALAGKTVALATLAVTEAITLGAGVTLLGGSGEQAKRVHDYLTGEDNPLQDSFWNAPQAPRHLVKGELRQRRTSLKNGGWIHALLASTRSARGPHPQRLRLDECDEMDWKIYSAATGQPLDRLDPITGDTIASQIVASSTLQYPDATMAKILEAAGTGRWPVHRWCYRETLEGWCTAQTVERKRRQVPAAVWDVEYELGEPSPEGRVLPARIVQAAFPRHLGFADGIEDDELIFEEPEEGALYGTGADWAKTIDWTIIPTARADREPAEVVAWLRTGRRPWPDMVRRFDERVRRYPGPGVYDATGMGSVVEDYVEVDAEPFEFVGKGRTELLSRYLAALEYARLVCPRIAYAFAEHKFATVEHVYGAVKHLPDTIAGHACMWRAVELARGVDLDSAIDEYREAMRRMRGEPLRQEGPGLKMERHRRPRRRRP